MTDTTKTKENLAGIYATVSAEVTAAGEGLASHEAKSPVTNNTNFPNNKDKTVTLTMTDEEEDLLLNPFANLGVEDGASVGTVDSDGESIIDCCSVASSNLSRLSTSSRRSKISNCRKTVKRLGARSWDELTTTERTRLHNARTFLQEELPMKNGPSAYTSAEASPVENTSVSVLMGPPASSIGKTHARKRTVSLNTPTKTQTDKDQQTTGISDSPARLCVGNSSPPGLVGEKIPAGEVGAEVTHTGNIQGLSLTCNLGASTSSQPRRHNERKDPVKKRTTKLPVTPYRRCMEPPAPTGLCGEKAATGEVESSERHTGNILGTGPTCNLNASCSSRPGNCMGNNTTNSDLTNTTIVENTTATQRNAKTATQRKTKRLLDDRQIQRRQLRNATRIVRILANKNPETLTVKERLALDRSRQRLLTIPKPTNVRDNPSPRSTSLGVSMRSPVPLTDPPANAGTSKRARKDIHSPTNVSPTNRRKKAKLSKVPVVGRQVAVVDYGNPARKLTEDQWQLIELRILEEVNEAIVKSRPPPLFGTLGTYQGFKMLTCEDEHTHTWLQEFVSKAEAPWPNADLRLMGRKEIGELSRPRAKLVMKGPLIPRDRIERYLRSLNTEQLSHNWEVVEMGEKTKDGTEVVVILNHKSIPLLRKIDYKVRVGTNRCRLRLIENKRKVNMGEKGF